MVHTGVHRLEEGLYTLWRVDTAPEPCFDHIDEELSSIVGLVGSFNSVSRLDIDSDVDCKHPRRRLRSRGRVDLVWQL
jgi:hypothetical protein